MNEFEFRNWMKKNGKNKKVISDIVSRIKRIERELDHCDIDSEYHSDRCSGILSLFLKKGDNVAIKKYPRANLPFGKTYMSSFRYAINQYIQFMDSQNNHKSDSNSERSSSS